MKTLVTNYTFDALTKKVTFTDYVSINLNQILLITNVTTNTTIYNFADASKGGVVSTNILTLTYNTTSMSDDDKLLIYYDDPAAGINLSDVYASLKLIENLLARPIWMEPGTARLKVALETAVATLTAVTTVTTVTSMTQLAGFDAKLTLLNSTDRNLWYNGVRRAIT